ncbi:MAG: preprotein translocase subunit SecE [Candidatus Omnitrophica bacterium]|nr:preprotein translocase subunit SecE [Candidatus Omnitrophota bacterium]
MLNIFKRLINFIKEVREELTKVSWSNREELMSLTFVVIITTSLMALFIFVVDFFLSKSLNMLLK